MGEKRLYNGIVIPEDFRFEADNLRGDRAPIPYLLSSEEGGYRPNVVNIDVGRQLFVDDFLISSTTLERVWHQAKTRRSPIFSERDTGVGNGTPATSGGLWYDETAELYRLWYGIGYGRTVGYAESRDGLHWRLPAIAEDGSNSVCSQRADSYSVWMDRDAPAEERFKMSIRSFDKNFMRPDGTWPKEVPANLYVSADGMHWSLCGESGPLGDRSTFFRNDLTGDWVFSIRMVNTPSAWKDKLRNRRTRFYHSGKTWREAAAWTLDGEDRPVFWLKTDGDDPPDKEREEKPLPQLYNFDSIAYESVMLGMFQIWYGPYNQIIDRTKTPKITELQASFSRDGFHYDRPVRGVGTAMIPASRRWGEWDYGYLQSMTGGLIVSDEELRIYYTGFSGFRMENGEEKRGAYSGSAIGIATLRRDGFASMDGTGELVTARLTVGKMPKHLFVNVNAASGGFRAELLDEDERVIDGFSAKDCIVISEDSCCCRVTWQGGDDLSFLRNTRFRIRFEAENASFYSFWLSEDEKGGSGGCMGAGYVPVPAPLD